MSMTRNSIYRQQSYEKLSTFLSMYVRFQEETRKSQGEQNQTASSYSPFSKGSMSLHKLQIDRVSFFFRQIKDVSILPRLGYSVSCLTSIYYGRLIESQFYQFTVPFGLELQTFINYIIDWGAIHMQHNGVLRFIVVSLLPFLLDLPSLKLFAPHVCNVGCHAKCQQLAHIHRCCNK